MFRNDFYEISCYKKGIIIYLRWFPSSANMSDIDFIEHIKMLNNIIEVMNSSILFIYTIDFNFPLKKPLIEQISELIQLGNLRWIGYAMWNSAEMRTFSLVILLVVFMLLDFAAMKYHSPMGTESAESKENMPSIISENCSKINFNLNLNHHLT